MRLGGEVHDQLAALHRLAHGVRVLDRALDELDPVLDVGQVLAPPGVGELVEHDDLVVGPRLEQHAHVGRADEPGGAGRRASSRRDRPLGQVGGQRPPASPAGRSPRCARSRGRSTAAAGRAGSARPSSSTSSARRARSGGRSPPRTRTTSTRRRPRCGGCRRRSCRSAARARRPGAPCRWGSRPGRARRRRRPGRAPSVSIVSTKLRPAVPKSQELRTMK